MAHDVSKKNHAQLVLITTPQGGLTFNYLRAQENAKRY